jgi:hypothetical protein
LCDGCPHQHEPRLFSGSSRKAAGIFRQEVRAKLRAVAALNNVELITHSFLSTGSSGLVGLQLRILNGVVSLLTTRIENKALPGSLLRRSHDWVVQGSPNRR